MVAYSFQRQFAEPILARRKKQTIRAVGKRRHARPGEWLQLYTGMRTVQCRKIAVAPCLAVDPVCINLPTGLVTTAEGRISSDAALDEFAIADGFTSWAELLAFWAKHHAGRPRLRRRLNSMGRAAMIVAGIKDGVVFQFGTTNDAKPGDEFRDARMIITALTTGGCTQAAVVADSRPALPVRPTSAEERAAIAAIIPKSMG